MLKKQKTKLKAQGTSVLKKQGTMAVPKDKKKRSTSKSNSMASKSNSVSKKKRVCKECKTYEVQV